MKKYTFVLLLISIIATSFLSASESYIKDTTENVIKLTHKKSNRVVYIKQGEIVNFTINKNLYKGKIQSITDKSLFINNKEYDIFEISKINILKEKTRIQKSGGGLLTIGGTLFLLGTVLGSLLLTEAVEGNGVYESIAILSFLYSLIIRPISRIFFLIGQSQKYHLKKWWAVEV